MQKGNKLKFEVNDIIANKENSLITRVIRVTGERELLEIVTRRSLVNGSYVYVIDSIYPFNQLSTDKGSIQKWVRPSCSRMVNDGFNLSKWVEGGYSIKYNIE